MVQTVVRKQWVLTEEDEFDEKGESDESLYGIRYGRHLYKICCYGSRRKEIRKWEVSDS